MSARYIQACYLTWTYVYQHVSAVYTGLLFDVNLRLPTCQRGIYRPAIWRELTSTNMSARYIHACYLTSTDLCPHVSGIRLRRERRGIRWCGGVLSSSRVFLQLSYGLQFHEMLRQKQKQFRFCVKALFRQSVTNECRKGRSWPQQLSSLELLMGTLCQTKWLSILQQIILGVVQVGC